MLDSGRGHLFQVEMSHQSGQPMRHFRFPASAILGLLGFRAWKLGVGNLGVRFSLLWGLGMLGGLELVYRIWGLGFRVRVSGFRIWGLIWGLQSLGHGVWEFRVGALDAAGEI